MIFPFQILMEIFSGKTGYLQCKGENGQSGFNNLDTLFSLQRIFGLKKDVPLC